MFIEQFLSTHFLKLPKWARVATYFVTLALFVFLLVSPRFVNGDVVAEKGGAVLPYRGVEIKTSVEGRTLKFKTNEDGLWSIPLLSRYPSDIRVAVKNVDKDTWLEVVLSKADIWGPSPHFRITIEDGMPPKASVRVVDSGQSEWRPPRLFAHFGAIAHAGELVLPKDQATAIENPQLKNNISENVNRMIARSLDKPSNTPATTLPFSGTGSPSYIDRIGIVKKLEDEYRLVIPDEHWQSLQTSQQVADYVYRRRLLEQGNPARYKIRQSYDWTRIEMATPPDQRPQFKTDIK